MRRKFKLLIVASSALIISSGCSAAVSNYRQVQQTQDQIKTLQSQYDSVKKQKLELEKTKSEQKKQLDQKVKTEKQLRDEIERLKVVRAEQAKQKSLIATQTAYAAPAALSSVIHGCGDNSYANFIYMHESGCNLNAVNAGGCRGIGQACPGSKLPCGADYACQNAFFTKYANATYGGWSGAYAFWQSHGWW